MSQRIDEENAQEDLRRDARRWRRLMKFLDGVEEIRDLAGFGVEEVKKK